SNVIIIDKFCCKLSKIWQRSQEFSAKGCDSQPTLRGVTLHAVRLGDRLRATYLNPQIRLSTV
ncbi:hypothetical protein OFN63_27545, partial [Escherichia coli]|nr:hypothetical protein [Escherichia coli]